MLAQCRARCCLSRPDVLNLVPQPWFPGAICGWNIFASRHLGVFPRGSR